jgi:hypothetical protein
MPWRGPKPILMNMPEQIVVPARKDRIRLQTAAVLFAVVASAAVMFSLEQIMHRDLRLIALVLASLGVVGFGYLLLLQIGRLTANPPLFRGDDEGLHFYASVFNQGTISWDNIREYGLVKHGLRKVALVYLHEPQQFLRNQSGLRGRLFRSHMKQYETPVALPAGLFDEDVVAVFERLSAYEPS